MSLPTTIDELTPDWLSAHLDGDALAGRTVASVKSDDIGTGTGIFGEIARLSLALDDGSTLSAVAKMPCVEPANLEVAKILGIYERELNMYAEIVPRSTLIAPTVLAAERGDDAAFVLILEDMSENWDVGDQVVGATLAQAEHIVDALVGLHAQWWESPELAELTWLPKPDAPQYLAAVPGIYRAGMEPLTVGWADRVADGAIDLCRRLEPRFEEILERTATGPSTIIHTDTRLDNILFSHADPSTVGFIDFQLALQGRAVADLAYLVQTSLARDIGANHWENLLRRWLDQITEAGITYTWDDAVTHYREAALYYLSGSMSLVGTFDAGNERGDAMAEAYVTRSMAHVVDIDAGAVL